MPEISRIGFGANDYASWQEWIDAENNIDYGVGRPPIARVGPGTPPLTGATQMRFNWPRGFIIEAEPGYEFNGNFGGSHAVFDCAGQTFDVRVANGEIRNVEILNMGTYTTGDTYENWRITNCGVRTGQMFFHRSTTNPVRFTNSIILLTNTGQSNRALYLYTGANLAVDQCTILGLDGSGALASVYVRTSSSQLDIRNTACFSDGDTFGIHSGDTPTVTGDYNAGNDALMPSDGGNSISTLTADDFVNYAGLDFRIKNTSALVGAGEAGGDIGAFVQEPTFNLDAVPTKVQPNVSLSITVSSPNTAPTTGNTSIQLGGPTGPHATIDSVTGSDPYVINFTYPLTTARKFSSVGYPLHVIIDQQYADTVTIKYEPSDGMDFVELVNVDPTSTIATQYLPTPTNGGQWVHDKAVLPNDEPITFDQAGRYVLGPPTPTVNSTMTGYFIAANGTVGPIETFTFDVGVEGGGGGGGGGPVTTPSELGIQPLSINLSLSL